MREISDGSRDTEEPENKDEKSTADGSPLPDGQRLSLSLCRCQRLQLLSRLCKVIPLLLAGVTASAAAWTSRVKDCVRLPPLMSFSLIIVQRGRQTATQKYIQMQIQMMREE